MILLFLISLSFTGLSKAITVNIPELGDIQGTTSTTSWNNRKIYQFLGIRYAMPPSGSRRFLPPEPVKAWNNVYNATAYGNACPTVKKMKELENQPSEVDVEDCLTLNVFTPNMPGNNSSLLPVMVFIPGGALLAGSAKTYPPNYFLEYDVMLVTIQYRLGPLGIESHQRFLSLHTDGIPGNAGFIDQVEALRWVNKYIKNFGGDNKRVTLFGGSAGACCVSLLLLSPIVEPYLFQKVIIQSAGAFAHWAIETDPLKMSQGIYKALTNSSEPVNVSVMEDKFRKASVFELLKATLANIENENDLNGLTAKGVVQKAGKIKFLTKHPAEYVVSGEYRVLPMIVGVVRHEGTFKTTGLYDIAETMGLQNDDEFLRNNLTSMALHMEISEIEDSTDSISEIFKMMLFKNLFRRPDKLTFRDLAPGISDLLSIMLFKGQALKQAKINAKYDANNTYLYTFEYRGEHTVFGFLSGPGKYPFDGGVCHGDEMIYLFPYRYKLPLNPADLKIAKLITELWTSFAIGSKPMSSHMNIEWMPILKDKDGPFLHINSSSYLGNDFVETEFMAITNEHKN